MNPFKDPPRPKTERPLLKDWQQDDAKRLEALWLSAGKPMYSSQDVFGRKFEIGSAQMVWQYIKGVRPLNLSVATKFAKGLQCRVVDISPTLAEELERLSQLVLKDRIEREENSQMEALYKRMTSGQRQQWIAFGEFLLKDKNKGVEMPKVAEPEQPYTWAMEIDAAANTFIPPDKSS